MSLERARDAAGGEPRRRVVPARRTRSRKRAAEAREGARASPSSTSTARTSTRKEQLLNHVATALHFPKDFGHNWDALEECLTDIEWVDADGYVIYYDHIDGAAHRAPRPVRDAGRDPARRRGVVEGGRHRDGGAAVGREGAEGRGEAEGEAE